MRWESAREEDEGWVSALYLGQVEYCDGGVGVVNIASSGGESKQGEEEVIEDKQICVETTVSKVSGVLYGCMKMKMTCPMWSSVVV